MTSAVVLFVYPIKLNISTFKERSYIYSTKEVILLFYLICLMQLTKCWTKFRVINTLITESLETTTSRQLKEIQNKTNDIQERTRKRRSR